MSSERTVHKESVQEIVESYLRLGNKFKNPPRIELDLRTASTRGKPDTARDISVTTAYQCYAPGISVFKDRSDEKSVGVELSTLKAGHHTTRMHTNYTWHLIGASRSVVHDVLHAYPFYNSEQQSQRYVEARTGNYLVPAGLSGEQEAHYIESADYSNQSYFKLLKAVKSDVEERVISMYPAGGWRVNETRERLNKKVDTICQEVARYALQIGQLTTLYHTLNEISLLRLFRASCQGNFSDEARFIIGSMVDGVAKIDPTIWGELDNPLPPAARYPFDERYVGLMREKFDEKMNGKTSLLKNPLGVNGLSLVEAVRNSLSLPKEEYTDAEVLDILLNPAKNKLLADVYETGMLDPLTSALRQLTLTFSTRLSHTGDSQRQRQRMTPGDTPSIGEVYNGTADWVTPLVIKENPELNQMFTEIILNIFSNVDKAIEIGIPREQALLLLPNAMTVRLVETGSLFDWAHRWKQRLCYLAQEEIFFISLDQVQQVAEVLPAAVPLLLAPCGVNAAAGISPRCPEGKRWCGQPVFNWKIENYKKHRLI